MHRSVLGPLIALILLEPACNPIQPVAPTQTPSPVIIVVENEGGMCFTKYEVATHELKGTFRPKGCFSSNCTSLLESKFDAKLVPQEAAMRFSGRFVIKDSTQRTSGANACRTDCTGAGAYDFVFTPVATGTLYGIWVGERKTGEFRVPYDVPPIRIGSPICIDP